MHKAFRFAIVGSGPAGFFAARHLLREAKGATIDIFEKLPSPFGLVRYGVAPDHPEVKNVINQFNAVASDPNVRFYGNVEVGRDISVNLLKRRYSATLFTHGAEDDKHLGLENEEKFRNVIAAKDFVNWYNVHPYYDKFALPSDKVRNVAIIGNGNVAVDVARILARPYEDLAHTDINDATLNFLRESSIKNIFMIGRRGCVQSAFTTKELRELTTLKDVEVCVVTEELNAGLNETSLKEAQDGEGRPANVTRVNRRKLELIKKLRSIQKDELPALMDEGTRRPKRIFLRYLRSPAQLIASSSDPSLISSIELETNKLEGKEFSQRAVHDPSAKRENLECDLLFRSIGYKTRAITDVLFDEKRSIIPNKRGAVVDKVY
eukprot:TRINITY_DN7272_c0_g1_i8.p1 TRINITY_DN7272_c0_g1~~TRINITY_DN7272_c0_g1_i8.p1  ORF type:complete len:378 (+),score=68.77 TRINITY_DN7272_c0_g1_i8:88-1221(+)